MRKKEGAVLINADDFGLTENCTRAIYEAFQRGLITDTTMVANGAAMEQAFSLAPELQGRIGVHINLTEGSPLTVEMRQNPRFVCNGYFTDYFRKRSNYFRPLSAQDRQDLYLEMTAQVERLLSGGIQITHADSHHHVHWNWMLAPIFFRVCREHGIVRVRCHKNLNGMLKLWNGLYACIYRLRLKWNHFCCPDHFEALRLYQTCPDGISEMMVHPDYDQTGTLIDRQRKETLPDGQVRALGSSLEELVRLHVGDAPKTSYAQL